ncbi:MAG: nicotinate (nicotinamide) nucleotide adenylyltransferase [Desulfovibrio sp.]|nr:nicotinate (nicotinamide) nucleotide adenylyltransferase [Desulfovibrio sp.]
MTVPTIPGRAILGGCFNPPHTGHLRLAVEVREALGSLVSGVDLVPCAVPPHKDTTGLLPFALRASMVEACIKNVPWLACNRLEARRQGPSFTWDTLLAYREAESHRELYFVLGIPDFAQLPLWHHGLDLPRLCHFVVVPRDDVREADFSAIVEKNWPTAREHPPLLVNSLCRKLPGGGLAHFLSVPRIAISSSQIRQLWLAGRSVDFLLPDVAVSMLREHKTDISKHWNNMARV